MTIDSALARNQLRDIITDIVEYNEPMEPGDIAFMVAIGPRSPFEADKAVQVFAEDVVNSMINEEELLVAPDGTVSNNN